MGSWDNVNEWRSTMAGVKSTFQNLNSDAGELAGRMEAQCKRLEATSQEVFRQRDIRIDAAYEALDRFVSELLQYTDGEVDIGIEGVPTLPIVVSCFKELAEFCESVVDKETLEAVEATQEIGEDGQIAARVKAWQETLGTTLNGLSQAVSRAEGLFNEKHGHHMSARDALNQAEGRRSDVMYIIFGDRDVDSAVDNCRRNEESWHRDADEAWNMWDQLRNLNNEHQGLLNNNLGQLSAELTKTADAMRSNYVKIGEERKVDSACWIASRALQFHVVRNTEYTSRDDALRHVFKLIHTVNKTVDSDSDVIRLKANIEDIVAAKLGEEKKEQLHKEKVYVSVEEEVDF